MPRLTTLLAALSLAALPETAGAQQVRVALLSLTPLDAAFRTWVAPEFEKGGYVAGRNLVVDLRHGSQQDLPAIARDIVNNRPDVVIAVSSASLAAVHAASPTVPIVTAGADPVGLGFAQSFSRPGGSVTGFVVSGAELDAKRLELLTQIFGTAQPVAALMLSGFPANLLVEQAMGAAATRIGVAVTYHPAAGPADYADAIKAVQASGARGMVVTTNPVFFRDTPQVSGLATAAGIATICEWPDAAERGCLIGYGPTRADLYAGATQLAMRILKGARPGDIPIERPSRFELAINADVARRLRLELPPDFIARADRLIE
jgi:putative ABC transport system substrate-binding protein